MSLTQSYPMLLLSSSQVPTVIPEELEHVAVQPRPVGPAIVTVGLPVCCVTAVLVLGRQLQCSTCGLQHCPG